MENYKILYDFLCNEIKNVSAALEDLSYEDGNPDFAAFGRELAIILDKAEEIRLAQSENNE